MINHRKTVQQGVHQGSATLSQSHGAESLSGWFHQQRWVCGQHNSWMVEHCCFSQLDWKRYNQISRNNGESVDYSWDNNIVTWGSRALLKSPHKLPSLIRPFFKRRIDVWGNNAFSWRFLNSQIGISLQYLGTWVLKVPLNPNLWHCFFCMETEIP